jgi:hypothetical protein
VIAHQQSLIYRAWTSATDAPLNGYSLANSTVSLNEPPLYGDALWRSEAGRGGAEAQTSARRHTSDGRPSGRRPSHRTGHDDIPPKQVVLLGLDSQVLEVRSRMDVLELLQKERGSYRQPRSESSG